MNEKKAVVRQTARRYQKASKREKGAILSEFTALTGYHRTYGSWLLGNMGRKVHLKIRGRPVAVILGEPWRKAKRAGIRQYGERFVRLLRSLWEVSDYLCGKRLVPFIRTTLPALERFGEINLDDDMRALLLKVSPATTDRLLREDKRKLMLRSRARTKPGTLLKRQIPIRTFSGWDDLKPGFAEMDLVGHDGGDASGEFAYTLNLTDVCTGWTEAEAVRNRAQRWTFEALQDIKQRMPFPLLGLDSDNDSAFINAHLLRYCEEKGITFTRSRPQRKNDNCFVEQKNYSVVRRAVGYMRYDTAEELKTLNKLYGYLRLYVNFFQPVMKLKEKTRIGSRIIKKYDTAKTPYQRTLESRQIDKAIKRRIKRQYESLNPAELKRTITKLQHLLTEIATSKTKRKKQDDFVYILT